MQLQVFECIVSWVQHDRESRQSHLADLMEYICSSATSHPRLFGPQHIEEEPTLLKVNLQCMQLSHM